jgi:serine/threonine-protein kinase
LYCWGNNDNGRLGDGTSIERRGATRVTGIAEAVASVGTGDSHTCAVDALGETWCWGSE